MTEARAEYVVQAHDQLHKGDVGQAHEMLHKAMGIDNDTQLPAAPMSHMMDFDAAFRTACRKNNRRAMYLVIDGIDANGRARILSGGDAELCALFDQKLRPVSQF